MHMTTVKGKHVGNRLNQCCACATDPLLHQPTPVDENASCCCSRSQAPLQSMVNHSAEQQHDQRSADCSTPDCCSDTKPCTVTDMNMTVCSSIAHTKIDAVEWSISTLLTSQTKHRPS